MEKNFPFQVKVDMKRPKNVSMYLPRYVEAPVKMNKNLIGSNIWANLIGIYIYHTHTIYINELYELFCRSFELLMRWMRVHNDWWWYNWSKWMEIYNDTLKLLLLLLLFLTTTVMPMIMIDLISGPKFNGHRLKLQTLKNDLMIFCQRSYK